MSTPLARRLRNAGLLVISLAVLALHVAAQTPGKIFKAGAATSNITPPIGAGIVGGFVIPASTHVHDELHARCLVLDDGTSRLAFAVVDSVSVKRYGF